jgi:hypothetical protein
MKLISSTREGFLYIGGQTYYPDEAGVFEIPDHLANGSAFKKGFVVYQQKTADETPIQILLEELAELSNQDFGIEVEEAFNEVYNWPI